MVRALPQGILFLASALVSASAVVDFGRCGGCDGGDDGAVERILQCQKASDFLIAAAYFSIPLELLYFASCSDLLPFKWLVLLFGAFIVLCGLTHLLSVFMYQPHPFHLALALTVAKLLTALVSFATAVTLLTLIPQLLRVKVREAFLRSKARELDRDVGRMKQQEAASWHVRMLTREIRKSLDRHMVLDTTMVELSRMLGLQNCAVWMPDDAGNDMVLVHQLRDSELSESCSCSIPMDVVDVVEIKAMEAAMVLRPDSALGAASSGGLESGAVAAIRMPMLKVSSFKWGTPEVVETSYAILVLVLPSDGSRGWSHQELEIVEVVADQVAVALSHAAVLEESQLMREKLAEQHRALLQEKNKAVMATKATNSFQSAMSDGMRGPMHSILGLLSVMQQEGLTTEQRLVIDTIVRTSSVVSTLMNDIVESSTMNRERLSLVRRPFDLHALIKEAISAVGCLSGCKGVDFAYEVDNSLPAQVIGDEKRLFHLLLHIVGTLISQSNAGRLSLSVNSYNECEEKPNQEWILLRSNFSGSYIYVKFEISIERPKGRFARASSSQISQGTNSNSSKMGLSFGMCKKIVQMMNGNIWSVSDSQGLVETVLLVLQFQLKHASSISSDLHQTLSIPKFNGLNVLLADSDDTSRPVTRKLLEKLGCQVVSISSGVQCLSSLGTTESSFQLVMLDLTVQAMDGFEVALRIRKFRSSCWPLLIVALAASTDDRIHEWCHRSGVNGLIQKPVTLTTLGDELYRLLQNN